jgi:peptidoglycan/xylan/chitin deacetylase (PgdA/CDA1 family)
VIARLTRLAPGGLRVVLYHHLADAGHVLVDRMGIATPTALFEAHVRRLSRDYDIVGLDDVLSGRLPRRALLITFDDGYRSVLDVGGPILRRLGLPAVFFVSSAFLATAALPLENLLCLLEARIGLEALEKAITGTQTQGGTFDGLLGVVGRLEYARRQRLGPELAARFGIDQAAERRRARLFLDADELSRLADFEIEVGNHTRSHLFCRTIVDEEVAQHELVEHKHDLEGWTGRPVRAFSYPYGYREDATPLVERVVAASGHAARFLVRSRPNPARGTPATWNRVSLHDRPVAQLGRELEVLPRLRACRDTLAAVGAGR